MNSNTPIKLKKGIDYKYKIPSYAPLHVGDVVRIGNARNLKKYEKSTEPYMSKLAVVIGYSTKSGGGPMTFAVRVLENGDEYLLYTYLLIKTGQSIWIPRFEEGDELINKSTKIDGQWVKVIGVESGINQNMYRVILSKDKSEHIFPEKHLRTPTEEELRYKSLITRLPELDGMF